MINSLLKDAAPLFFAKVSSVTRHNRQKAIRRPRHLRTDMRQPGKVRRHEMLLLKLLSCNNDGELSTDLSGQQPVPVRTEA
jgi:hypothetical protein